MLCHSKTVSNFTVKSYFFLFEHDHYLFRRDKRHMCSTSSSNPFTQLSKKKSKKVIGISIKAKLVPNKIT